MVLLQTAFSFGDTINYLVEIGVYDVFLPFLLVFAIVFAILEKTQILGTEKTNINAIVAVVVGLLLIVQKGIVETINLFLPRVSLIMVVVLMGLLLITMLGGNTFQGLSGATLGIAIVLVIIAIIMALTSSPALGTSFLSPSDKEALLRMGIPIGIFLLVIWFITSGPRQQPRENVLERIAREFTGQGNRRGGG